jgi:hypothetical protein
VSGDSKAGVGIAKLLSAVGSDDIREVKFAAGYERRTRRRNIERGSLRWMLSARK